MKKNKIPKRLLFFILSIMLMFPIISYAENDFKHMECIDCKCNVSEFPYI